VKEPKNLLIEIANRVAEAATDSDLFKQIPIISAVVAFTGFCDAMMKIKLARNIVGFLNGAEAGASADELDSL